MTKVKRMLSIFLVLCMVIAMLPAATAVGKLPFSDVSKSDWFYDAVAYVYESGMMNGTNESTFSPNATTTRGMIVTILHRLEGTPHAYGEKFTDVAENAYYAEAVAWASAQGIVGGYGNGCFGPDDAITRQQLAAIFFRYAGFYGKNIVPRALLDDFNDGNSVAEYAVDAMQWAVATDLIKGDGGCLNPNGFATRAQVATILERFCGTSADIIFPAIILNDNDNDGDDIYTVTFDSNGGSEIPEQKVEDGECVKAPNDPEKESFVFLGWYLTDGYSAPYDFNAPVEEDITIYAKWFDKQDTTDTDGDGLTDQLEQEFGSDPTQYDTDNDGISDYTELNWLNYNPACEDSDDNGIADADEDPDGDGLNNSVEESLGTNASYDDTDNDYLSDTEEVNVYLTDPVKEDTDGDGVNDGTEVMLGTDPLTVQEQFETAASSGVVSETSGISVSASVITDAEGAGTLHIEELSSVDNMLISPSINGYLGSAFDFTTDGTLESAKITFHYDPSLGQIGEDFQPRIYYFNEETELLEELPDQTVTDGEVSAEVSHFSVYVLLNKVEYDKIWEWEIKTPQNEEEQIYTGMDVVFVIDSSGSMSTNDPDELRKQAAIAFVGKLGEHDRAAVIDFDNYAYVNQNFTGDHESLELAINRIDDSGGTNLWRGMSAAINLFTEGYTRTDAYKYIIFLTDGDGSYSEKYTTKAKEENIVVYTIGLGEDVREDRLRPMAENTGGKYYFASAADVLSDIYMDVSFETVDYSKDTNNDNICDYYTSLLNDGKLPLSTGSFDLIGVLEMYGETSSDWDGDGLLNGEEIEVCQSGTRVYVKMTSHPLLVDSDFDGYTDAEEKEMKTPPMKYSSDEIGALNRFMDDEAYTYISVAENNAYELYQIFDWQKRDESKELMIDYFYDYASKESIEKNKSKIARLKASEENLKFAQSLANVVKAASDICTGIENITTMAKGYPDEGTAKQFIDKARSGNIKIKGASRQITSKRKIILDAMNSGNVSKIDVWETAIGDVKVVQAEMDAVDKIFEEYEGFDWAREIEAVTGVFAATASLSSSGVKAFKLIYDGAKYMKLDTGFKAISKGYKKFLDKKGGKSFGTYLSVGLEVVDGGLEIWGNCNQYGKMKANRDAYIAYTDLLYYMEEHADEKYTRYAAGCVADIVADETWREYEKQLANANGKTIAFTTLSIVCDLCPYTRVAKTVWDIVVLTIEVTGIGANGRAVVACKNMQAISDGCKYILKSNMEIKRDDYFSYSPYDRAYLIQLAQSRIVGEEFAKKRAMRNDLGAILGRWLTATGKDDIEENYKIIFRSIYNYAWELKLELSEALPEYEWFYKELPYGGAIGGALLPF